MTTLKNNIGSMVQEHIRIVEHSGRILSTKIETAVEWMVDAFETGKKVLIAGNGGSAADAQHIAAEFVGRFRMERPSLPAIALTTDTSILTAIGNDYGFDRVFVRQLEGMVREGDIFWAISTSGNSDNIIEAVKVCREHSCKVIGLLGNGGGKLAEMVDLPIIVPSSHTARIQEVHIAIGHIISELVENTLYGSAKK